jgi:diadenosine tetraphosphate (Ap4A) HIT family hydrolase
MQTQKKSLDSILDDLGTDLFSTDERPETKPVTMWIPNEYKSKYDELQEQSKKKFGKKLQELVMASIDRVYQTEI